MNRLLIVLGLLGALSGPSSASPPPALIENLGQWPERVKFLSPRGGSAVQLEGDAILFAQEGHAFLRLAFEGAGAAKIAGEDPGRCRYAFYHGRDAARWRSDVRAYGSALFEELYPGIDLRFRTGPTLEYDLVARPGADLEQVVIRCDGSRSLRLDDDGALVIETEGEPVRQSAPETWQLLRSGERRAVHCEFQLLSSDRFGFRVEGLDPTLPLTIDPILEWAVAASGTGGPYDELVLEADGNLLYTPAGGGSLGAVIWAGIPCSTVSASSVPTDAEVVVVDVETGETVSVILFGGDGNEEATALALAPDGSIVIAGFTISGDLPVTNGSSLHGTPGDMTTFDVFVARFDAAGCGLDFATYLGGSLEEGPTAIAVEKDGGILVSGFTDSDDFPVAPGALQGGLAGGYDIFISRLRPEAGTDLEHQLAYSSYLGGEADETWPLAAGANHLYDRLFTGDMLLDAEGRVILGGQTHSEDFPITPGAYQGTMAGTSDTFIVRLDLDPALDPVDQLLYSTFLGGANLDGSPVLVESIDKMSFDPIEGIWVTGETVAADFPVTPGAYTTGAAGALDVFFSHLKLDPDLGADQLLYSGRVGGGNDDLNAGISVSLDGVATLGPFFTSSINLPVTPDAYPSRSNQGLHDSYLLQIDLKPATPAGDRLLYAAYCGGAAEDQGDGLAVTPSGRVICSLNSASAALENLDTLITQGPIFLRYDLRKPKAVFTAVGPTNLDLSLDASPSTTPAGTRLVSYSWDFGDGATSDLPQAAHTYAGPGRYCVTLSVMNDLDLIATHSECFTFSCPPGESSPWIQREIAGTSYHSTAIYPTNGTFGVGVGNPLLTMRLCSGGQEISGKSDSFFFVHQEAEGDLRITAKFLEPSTPNVGAQVGLMIRESLDPDERNLSIVLQREKTDFILRSIFRRKAGSSSLTKTVAHLSQVSLRLERRGDEVEASMSTDGQAWTSIEIFKFVTSPNDTSLSNRLFFGVASAGKDKDPQGSYVPLQAEIDNPEIESLAPPAPFFRRGDVDASGRLDISDPVGLLGYLFLGETSVRCLDAGDVNDDGKADISDAVASLNFQFLGGDAPAPPGPDSCGPDVNLEEPDLGCATGCP